MPLQHSALSFLLFVGVPTMCMACPVFFLLTAVKDQSKLDCPKGTVTVAPQFPLTLGGVPQHVCCGSLVVLLFVQARQPSGCVQLWPGVGEPKYSTGPAGSGSGGRTLCLPPIAPSCSYWSQLQGCGLGHTLVALQVGQNTWLEFLPMLSKGRGNVNNGTHQLL